MKINKEQSVENWEKRFEEILFSLAEKHCKHDDDAYNSCIYHILKEPLFNFIKEELETQRVNF